MTTLLGKHSAEPERAYSVLRVSGLETIFVTGGFATAILATKGALIATPGWKPLMVFAHGYITIGGWLLVSAFLAVAGLAFDDNDVHRWPRDATLISALMGMLWFGIATFAFAVAWRNWLNAGPFLSAYGFIVHGNRFWLLNTWRIPRRLNSWRRG